VWEIWKIVSLLRCRSISESESVRTVPKIQNIYPQKWNCAASFPIYTFLYLWAIYIFPRSASADRLWEYINPSQIHECENWETVHYNSVLEITRPRSFVSENTSVGFTTFILDSHQPLICSAVQRKKCFRLLYHPKITIGENSTYIVECTGTYIVEWPL
jgi:hypothetical protein